MHVVRRKSAIAALLAAMLGACSVAPPGAPTAPAAASRAAAAEVVLFSLGLIDSGYRFGGDNPEAGLDCSGLVGYVYERTLGLRLPHDAARIAKSARPVAREALQPGDLVFFNTLDRPFSHVGIYIGDERFIHAPASRGRVRIDSLRNRYYASRFESARSLFAD
ncbi:MAG: hypothetical protein OHK0026_12730 [Rhodocyclaceae bacterium]